ncbi:MAG: tyrosine-protein phosphatase [Tannerellaceae bacterium]|nr:tyrosine-protein phosphatase [Tannerellaceae bacterium]
MSEKFLFLLSGIIALTSCSSPSVEVRSVCLRDAIGNYIIKWETDPPMEGLMKLYVSDNPDQFMKSRTAGQANIADNIMTYITNDNVTRKYFLLTFNEKYPQILGSRYVPMDEVDNLRDLGGYPSSGEYMTRWGKVYRSGDLYGMTVLDSIRMSNLGIRTIIDLRTEEEVFQAPVSYTGANVIHIPVSNGNYQDIHNKLINKRARKGDGMLFMQDLYLQYITENNTQFAKALEVFLDKDNYPILFNCTYGKDRAGFLAAMLLSALDVPEETIYRDYTLSNQYINIRRIDEFARTLDTYGQETITVMLAANEGLLDLAFRKIKKEYGSVDKYLSSELNLNEKKRAQLKDIMLYGKGFK